MIRPIPFILAISLLGSALAYAQDPPKLSLPRLSNLKADAPPPADSTKEEPLYLNPREAALAAFKAGYADAGRSNRERAIAMFLLSLRRDPTLAKSLYNLAVLCAQGGRWSDAINFQNEFLKQPQLDSTWKKSSGDELERLRQLELLDRTPEGKARRKYDEALWKVLQNKDPFKASQAANELVLSDKERWEGHAFVGIYAADTKAFSDSAKALEDAARLAPAGRKPTVQRAADKARDEARFGDQLAQANALWERQEYAQAGKAYQDAWKTISSRVEVGMQAAANFLMADQVPAAVQILSELLGEPAAAGTAKKIKGMLDALGAVSADAASAAKRPAAPAGAPAEASAAFIRSQIGSLSSREIELVIRPDPPLLADTTFVTPMKDLEVYGVREDMFRSTDSIFQIYKRDLAAAEALRAASEPAPAAPAPSAPAPTPAAVERAPTSAAARKPVGSGTEPEVSFAVTTVPAGARIRGDVEDVKFAFNCVTPCALRLLPGRHTLHATLPGYQDERRVFTLEKGKTHTEEIRFNAKIGHVKVVTPMPGVPIYVNGEKTDAATATVEGENMAVLKLPEGEYEVGVEIDGKKHSGKIKVIDGGRMKLPFPGN